MQNMLPLQAQKTVRRVVCVVCDNTHEQPCACHRLLLRYISVLLVLLVLLVFWQAVVSIGNYAPFILPGPITVAERLIATIQSGLLWSHTGATITVALGGFGVALVVAVVLGYTLANIPALERILAPLLAASQAIPILAVAPLIILWFSTGISSKIIVAALITVFPMLLSTITALRNIPRELREMARMSGANRWQLFRHVELPLALPVFFSGVRTSLSLATTGAVVAEFIAGREGLGALITIARGLFDTPLIFVALLTLATITTGLYVAASLLERALVQWER